MNDLYKEIMVKPRPSQTNALKKGLLIAAAVLVFAAGMLFVQPLVMLGGIVLLFLEIWLIFPRFSVEYEYLYVNGDIDIDEIYSKSTRKRKGSYDNSSLVVMAPTGSAHLDGYQNRQGVKVLDYSSREPNVKTWTLVYGDGSDQKMLILELPDEVVQDMRRYSPQKVYLQ